MSVNHPICECKSSAAFFCLDHLVFLCERHAPTHKCSLETIDDFIGHLEHQKKRMEKKLAAIREDLNKQAAETSELKVLAIKESSKLIQDQLDSLAKYYPQSLENACQLKFSEKTSPLAEMIAKFNGRQYVEFYRLVKATPQESLKETYRLASDEVSKLISKDLIFQSVSEFSHMIINQLKNLQSIYDTHLSAMAVGSIDDQKLRFVINDMIVKENKFNVVEPKGIPRLEAKRRLSTLADYVFSLKDKNLKGGKTEPQRRNTKDSRLTETAKIIVAHEESLVEKSFSISDNSGSRFQSGRRLNQVSARSALTDFSFESDEILSEKELKEEEVVPEETMRPRKPTYNEITLKQKFERSQEYICCLMDKSLYDFSCDGFFDKQHKMSVNVYLDMFRNTFEESLMELKNNFNRL
jgi:hypothetical protein